MKLAMGVGLSATIVAVLCVLLAMVPADAQFGFGANRFFRNFQRGATNVFRPMFFRRPRPTFSSQPTFASQPR